MGIRLDKPWTALTAASVKALPGQLGVYQLADPEGEIFYIGYAGGRSLFGLRSELQRWLKQRAGQTTQFRYEVTMQYISRHAELLMLHRADFGGLPVQNTDIDPRRLGRLSPA